MNISVLVPASSAEAANVKNPGPALQAQWKNVVLMPENASYDEQGQCELIEQFKETFLPLFVAERQVRLDLHSARARAGDAPERPGADACAQGGQQRQPLGSSFDAPGGVHVG